MKHYVEIPWISTYKLNPKRPISKSRFQIGILF